MRRLLLLPPPARSNNKRQAVHLPQLPSQTPSSCKTKKKKLVLLFLFSVLAVVAALCSLSSKDLSSALSKLSDANDRRSSGVALPSTAISNSSSGPTSAGGGFSACLLWMDDNFRLPEWISYHHYMANLTHLVVAVDERSKTSPIRVLEKWKTLRGMTVEVWSRDADYTTLNLTVGPNDTPRQKLDKHRRRQTEFYRRCAIHLQKRNRSWTSFHDSDEFLVVTKEANLVSRDKDSKQGGGTVTPPGVILGILQQYGATRTSSFVNTKEGANRDPELYRNWTEWFSSRPCTTIPRVLFSAVVLDDEKNGTDNATTVPPSVADLKDRLETIRYRYQATPRRKGATDGLAKAVMDVSRLPPHVLEIAPQGTAHRPFRHESLCQHAFPPTQVLPLVIHHYLGSWEAFSYRDDARKGGLRSREKWEARSVLKEGGKSDDAVSWLSGFVAWLGPDQARSLLAGAGLPPDYKKSEAETAEWATRYPK
jgi:hypothetical protein